MKKMKKRMSNLHDTNSPIYAHPSHQLVPNSDHLNKLMPIPPSKMFLIKKSLQTFQVKHPDSPIYNASQGDGGASLPGVLPEIMERALQIQIEAGTSYTMPYGTDYFRLAVLEKYWQVDQGLGIGPKNIIATMGGRDGLLKAYQAMIALGYGRHGDALIVSRVPWISYTWGPYGIGANVILAPGCPDEGWAYSEESIRECVEYASRSGRKVAGLIITSPDNPTGLTLSAEAQACLAKAALRYGVAFVLFDWMYHYVTDDHPMDLNYILRFFSSEERKRLIFLDGITKSLGGSNIRNAHLIASEEVIKYMANFASHGVIPSLFSISVATVAYDIGFENASRSIVEPTNQSRQVLRDALDEYKFRYIIGQGYYAFIDMSPWLSSTGWKNTEVLGEFLAGEYGIAVVPGVFNSTFGEAWIRFSYAMPPEKTKEAVGRLKDGLDALI